MNWSSADIANATKKASPASPVQRKPPASTSAPLQPNEAGRAQEKEPAEKHVSLPPPPADCGPWQVGSWCVRRTTTYDPAARVVLTGPAEDFDKLLTHLQAFKP
jgi:hypothetical protein